MSYYEINKERLKQYNLNRYHQMTEDKKEKLLKERNAYFIKYYEQTKILKGKYNKTKKFDITEWKKDNEKNIKQYQKIYQKLYRQYRINKEIEIYTPELPTNTELDLYDIF